MKRGPRRRPLSLGRDRKGSHTDLRDQIFAKLATDTRGVGCYTLGGNRPGFNECIIVGGHLIVDRSGQIKLRQCRRLMTAGPCDKGFERVDLAVGDFTLFSTANSCPRGPQDAVEIGRQKCRAVAI